MIINPSPLYVKQGWHTGTWKKISLIPDRPYFFLHCICSKKPITLDLGLPTIENMPKTTEIKGDAFNHPKRKKNPVIIWAGQCEHCKIIHWTCDSYDWIEWLTDYETIHMLVEAMPIRNVRHASASSIHILGETVYFFDNQGRLEAVR